MIYFIQVTDNMMGGWLSGRASALQAEGHWFKSSTTHSKKITREIKLSYI